MTNTIPKLKQNIEFEVNIKIQGISNYPKRSYFEGKIGKF